jgi:hypothetical protein
MDAGDGSTSGSGELLTRLRYVYREGYPCDANFLWLHSVLKGIRLLLYKYLCFLVIHIRAVFLYKKTATYKKYSDIKYFTTT